MDLRSFSRAILAQLCVISFLSLTLVHPVESARKCSRNIRNFREVPVHKNFDVSRFAGTWYTVTRTTFIWGKKTFKSFSLEVVQNDDGSLQFSFTGQGGDTCLPVTTGVLEELKERRGQFILRVSGEEQPTFIVSFTDYKKFAMVYYCFQHRNPEQCQKDGMQVEIISKDLNPKKRDLNAYIKRAAKRLCVQPKMLRPTTPGLCKIPDILAAAKQREMDSKEEDAGSSEEDVCAVNNIPVQEDFSGSQLQGLWYEIARTRFTFNKMESVVNFHRYDNLTNQIYSYYTGTVIDQDGDEGAVLCATAIRGMSKTVDGAEYDSDRLGRIGWDDSTYSWSVTKVLYADEDYILFYGCYSGALDARCNNEYMEVSLSGRSREISQEKQDYIYTFLEGICVNQSDMIETQFLENCTSLVTVQPDEVEPEDCKLDHIQVYDDYVSTQMAGTWYLYSSISFNNVTSLKGVVMENKLAFSEGIETRTVAYTPSDDTCNEYFSRSRDMCYDTADHITTLPGGDGNFVFSKVLYLDNDILVEYTCSARTVEGTCERHGILFSVYTLNDTSNEDFEFPDETHDVINQLAKSVCLDPNDIQLETEWCDISAFAANNDSTEIVDCDLDQIEVFGDMGGYVQEKIYGYWYEVMRSSQTSRTTVTSAVAYFTATTNETLNIHYTGLSNEAVDDEGYPVCSEVLHGSMIARCRTDIIGDFLYRFEVNENYTTYVPFKILYTDYNNTLVTYMCTEMLPSGNCSETGTEISVWSKHETLDDESRQYVEDMILCTEPLLVDVPTNNSACKSNLEDYVFENKLDILSEDDNDEEDDDDESDTHSEDGDDNEKQQRDQGRNKYELSDIEAALYIDDDEFYYGQ